MHINRRTSVSQRVAFTDYDYFAPLTATSLLLIIGVIVGIWWIAKWNVERRAIFANLKSMVRVVSPESPLPVAGTMVIMTAPLRGDAPITDGILKPVAALELAFERARYPYNDAKNVERLVRFPTALHFGPFDGANIAREYRTTHKPTALTLVPKMLEDPTLPIAGASVYLQGSPAHPMPGDLRVTYDVLLPALVTVVGRVNGKTIEAITTAQGRSIGLLLTPGPASLYDIERFQAKADEFYGLLACATGFAVLWLALQMFLTPFRNRFTRLPSLASYARWLSIGFALPLTCLIAGACYTYPRAITLLLLLTTIPAALLLFVFFNRETPTARKERG